MTYSVWFNRLTGQLVDQPPKPLSPDWNPVQIQEWIHVVYIRLRYHQFDSEAYWLLIFEGFKGNQGNMTIYRIQIPIPAFQIEQVLGHRMILRLNEKTNGLLPISEIAYQHQLDKDIIEK